MKILKCSDQLLYIKDKRFLLAGLNNEGRVLTILTVSFRLENSGNISIPATLETLLHIITHY